MFIKSLLLLAGLALWGGVAEAQTLSSNYGYDAVGRITSVKYTASGGSVYIAYCYDANGNRYEQLTSTQTPPTCPSPPPNAPSASLALPGPSASSAQATARAGSLVGVSIGGGR